MIHSPKIPSRDGCERRRGEIQVIFGPMFSGKTCVFFLFVLVSVLAFFLELNSCDECGDIKWPLIIV